MTTDGPIKYLFDPVTEGPAELLCSRDCRHRIDAHVVGFWAWLFGSIFSRNYDIVSTCKMFRATLGVFSDGDKYKVQRCEACRQCESRLVPLDYAEREEPKNVHRLPVHRHDSLGDFDETFERHLHEQNKGHLVKNWGKR